LVWGGLMEGSYPLKVPRPLKRLTTLEFCCRTGVPTPILLTNLSILRHTRRPSEDGQRLLPDAMYHLSRRYSGRMPNAKATMSSGSNRPEKTPLGQ